MNKVSLFFAHGVLSYLLAALLTYILYISGVLFRSQYYPWAYIVGFAVIFFSTLISAKVLSNIFLFQERDAMFTLLTSFILGSIIIFSADNGLGEKVNSPELFYLILFGYLLSTFIFLRSKKLVLI